MIRILAFFGGLIGITYGTAYLVAYTNNPYLIWIGAIATFAFLAYAFRGHGGGGSGSANYEGNL